MNNGNTKRLEDILTDPESSTYDRALAISLLAIKSKIDTIENMSKIQLMLLSTIIMGLITIALAVKGVI